MTLQVVHDLYEPRGIFVMCLNSFRTGLQLEEMKHLIKLFIHSFLYVLLEFFSSHNINGKFILLIFMVNLTKLFAIAPGVGLVDLLSHELYLQIQRPLIPLLPSPPKWRWAMRGTALYSQAKRLTVNIMHQQINYQRNLLKYRARNNGRSTDNVWTDCGFDRSNFRLAGHVDRSKFNRIENEIN